MESTSDNEPAPPVAQPASSPAAFTPVLVKVLPDTGHHFIFVPFNQPKSESAAPTADFLTTLCQNNAFPWRQARDLDGQPVRWILYRFAEDGQKRCGIAFAIETNLGTESRGWVCRLDVELPSNVAPTAPPYAFSDVEHLPESGIQLKQLLLPTTPQHIPPHQVRGTSAELTLEIHWQNAIATPVDVDLIVDFGNTRTVALLLERSQAGNGSLSQVCRPLTFWRRAEEPGTVDQGAQPAVVDSWLALQEATFACLEPLEAAPLAHQFHPVIQLQREIVKEGFFIKKQVEKVVGVTERVPHMFVDLSPAVLGNSADPIVVNLHKEAGGNYFLSSPKRYLWDDNPVGDMAIAGLPWWTQYPQTWNPNFEKVVHRGEKLEKLAGTVLRFLFPDGRDWNLDENTPPPVNPNQASRPVPRPDEPCYPRADAVTWAALSILETALRQIRSKAGRPAGQEFVPARLASVIVTFPPGWTAKEVESYKAKWQKAVDILTVAHFPDHRLVSQGGSRPDLRMDLDEAVASQLPIVYGEIERLGRQGENWLEVVGRGEKTDAKARVLNLDIGGGTTDVAVIEYQDHRPGAGVDLHAQLLYRDSSTIAGDVLVQRIIERILLPAIAPADSAQRTSFENLLRAQKVGGERQQWSKFSRLVFVPIVRSWLAHYAPPDAPANIYKTPLDLGANAQALGEFNEACGNAGLGNPLPQTSQVNCTLQGIEACVRLTFVDLFRSFAKVAEAFDCDLAIISGKPSEVFVLRELLQAHLPLLPQRVIFAKDFEVGSWYPLSRHGRIEDAKTVTVAGAALYQAIGSGHVPDWTIKRLVSPHLLTRNYWGTMPIGTRTDFGQVCLEPNEDEKVCRLQIGQRIGRRLLPADTRPEPVYLLQWADKSRYRAGTHVVPRLDVTLRRVLPEGVAVCDGVPPAERLEIVHVEGTCNGQPIKSSDVRLSLCTLENDSHWLDQGCFEVIYPSPDDQQHLPTI